MIKATSETHDTATDAANLPQSAAALVMTGQDARPSAPNRATPENQGQPLNMPDNMASPDADTAPEMDATQLVRLMELTGPQVGARLIVQLIADLREVEHGLLQAFDPPDWTALQAQSHVLTALAGTVGAKRLRHLAEMMNVLAQSGSGPSGLLPLRRDLMAALERLIQFLKSRGDIQRVAP